MAKWLNGYWTTPNFSSLQTLVHFRHLIQVELVECKSKNFQLMVEAKY